MFITRLATAALLLTGCLAALFLLSNAWWTALLLAALLGAAWEWSALAGYGRGGRRAFCGTVLVSAVLLYAAAGSARAPGVELAVYAAGCAFWLLVAPLWLARGWRARSPLPMAVAGWMVLLPAWLALARLQIAPVHLLQLLGIVWLADTAAYLTGRAWGRRKLAPGISPGKTWEGVAGAAVAVAVYYVTLVATGSTSAAVTGPGGWLLFSGVMVMSIVGDLLESWIKRQAGVKDSGTLLPGHGGILDRIDGLTAAMPLAALMSRYLA